MVKALFGGGENKVFVAKFELRAGLACDAAVLAKDEKEALELLEAAVGAYQIGKLKHLEAVEPEESRVLCWAVAT